MTDLTIKDRRKKALSTSIFSSSLVIIFLTTSNKVWIFSLALLFLLSYFWKHFLVFFTMVARLRSKWAFAFVIFSAYYSNTFVLLPNCLPILPVVINSWFSLKSLWKFPLQPLGHWLILQLTQSIFKISSWAMSSLSLWTSLLFRTDSKGVLPTSVLKSSVFQKSKVAVLLTSFLTSPRSQENCHVLITTPKTASY